MKIPRKKSSISQLLLLAFAIAFLLGSLTIVNLRFARVSPGGSDFVPRWLGTRLLITEGINPYSDRATLEIQEFYYGHEAHAGQDQVLFAYPLYSALVFAPFAAIADYHLARAVWMTFLQVAVILLALISFRLANWKPPTNTTAIILIFALLWYHNARPIINGNASLAGALFIAGALLAIRYERDFLAGFLLILASIKPQMVVLLIPFVLLWALSTRRWKLIASILFSTILLTALALAVNPEWIGDNLRQVLAYPEYTRPGTPRAILAQHWPSVGHALGLLITATLSVVLLWLWRSAWNSDFETFLWVAILTLAITNLIGVRTATSNYAALFPGLILVFATVATNSSRLKRAATWLCLFAALFGLWALFVTTRSGLAESLVMFFPLPFFLVIAMVLLRPGAGRRFQTTKVDAGCVHKVV